MWDPICLLGENYTPKLHLSAINNCVVSVEWQENKFFARSICLKFFSAIFRFSVVLIFILMSYIDAVFMHNARKKREKILSIGHVFIHFTHHI